jgi:hypothetical protein
MTIAPREAVRPSAKSASSHLLARVASASVKMLSQLIFEALP